MGFLLIVITNQPVVARGWLSEKQLQGIHEILKRRLMKQGAEIDGIYYCPHHPQATLKKYRKLCACRKPAIGLIKEAIQTFDIDVKKSFFIGDSTRDVLAGKKAGLKTILVRTGNGGNDGKYIIKPHIVAKNLLVAVDYLC